MVRLTVQSSRRVGRKRESGSLWTDDDDEARRTIRVDIAAQQVEPFRFALRRSRCQWVEEVGPSRPGCEGLFGLFKAGLAWAEGGRLQVDFDDCVALTGGLGGWVRSERGSKTGENGEKEGKRTVALSVRAESGCATGQA